MSSTNNLNQFLFSLGSQLANLATFVQTFAKTGVAAPSTTNAAVLKADKKKKKSKEPKDPNAPKKPLSSYLLFCGTRQGDIKAKSPSATFTEISKIIGEEWRSLSSDKKKKFYKKEEEAKKEYAVKLAEYNKKIGIAAPEPTNAAKNKSQKKAERKAAEKAEKNAELIEKVEKPTKTEKPAKIEKVEKTVPAIAPKVLPSLSESDDSDSESEIAVKPTKQVEKNPTKKQAPKKESSSESDSSDSESEEKAPIKKKKN